MSHAQINTRHSIAYPSHSISGFHLDCCLCPQPKRGPPVTLETAPQGSNIQHRPSQVISSTELELICTVCTAE